MPRFFFNMRSGRDYLPDTEGQEHTNLEQARMEALLAAREMLAERLQYGDAVVDSHVFEITDSEGNILLTVPFRDAVKFS